MLYLVTGEVTVYHYPDDRETQNFTHIISAENEDEVEVIIGLLYELQGSSYATSYSPTIRNLSLIHI